MSRSGVKWLVGVATTIALGLGTWAGASIIDHGQRIAAREAEQTAIVSRLDRIEDLLIQLLRDK